ncbi:MAG: FtsX-like permease family protein [Flavobacteriaceae bacterium]|nr:FtsX-like permease family protein [Flavobacteriaceae bacterium]
MALFVVLSAFGGLKEFGLSLNNFFYAPYTVFPKEGKYITIDSLTLQRINQNEKIQLATPEIQEKVFLNRGQRNQVAFIKGVKPEYNRIIPLDTIMPYGFWPIKESKQVIMGYGIVSELDMIGARENEIIQIMVPKKPKRLGFFARGYTTEPFNVVGFYQISQELDNRYVYSSLESAQKLLELNPNQYSSLLLTTSPFYSMKELHDDLNTLIEQPFVIKTKLEQNAALYRMLNNEHLAIYFIFTLVMIIALFNVVGSLIMMIIVKKPQFSIFLSLGLTLQQIRHIFFYVGLQICCIGVCFGLLLGSTLVLIQSKKPFLYVPGTFLPYPVRFEFTNLLLVLLTVIVLGVLCSWWTTYGIGKQKTKLGYS